MRLAAFSMVFVYASLVGAVDLDMAKLRCSVQSESDPVIFNSDFTWSYSAQQMKAKFQEMYTSDKRLANRVYFDTAKGQFLLPIDTISGIQPIALSEEFIRSVISHIEESLKNEYIEYVFFPDLGHAHLLVPKVFYTEKIKDLPVKSLDQAYALMLDNSNTRVLYHTAEQLQMQDEQGALLQDRHLQWRFYTRNLVGELNSSRRLRLVKAIDTKGNTASDPYNDFHWWSAGPYLSANKEGCFSFQHQGKTYYFDLNYVGLPSNGAAGDLYDRDVSLMGKVNGDTPIWLWELMQPTNRF